MENNYGDLYNIRGWGDPYFLVNEQGHLCVKPHGDQTKSGEEIDVYSVIEEAKDKKKLQFPMILRFPEVLEHRLNSLHAAFNDAIDSTGYGPKYKGVFPVKVNQNKAVVQDLVEFGQSYNYGLEAGSKPELLIAMSFLTEAKPGSGSGAFLVCNGYKDADYIKLALSARAMGLNAIIVLEMEEELDIVIEQSQKLGIEPVIGVRAKLLTKIPGHFGSTAGKHGKFGLLKEKIFKVAEKLKDNNKLQWLKLLHFHVGSMIPDTKTVHDAATEAAGIYCDLVKKYDAEMTTLDCGGGLGVDYDGTRSGGAMSVAYGLEQYASSIVQAVRIKCDSNGVPHPVLCTESGRAMVSHHSMIILEALSATPDPQDDINTTHEELLSVVEGLMSTIQKDPIIPSEGTAVNVDVEGIQKHGIELYKVAKKLSKKATSDAHIIYNYHMNLSVFSLVPDFWGIKQLFPMMPVRRLNEEPTHKGTLVDITCDSDGKIEKFIDGGLTLPLHPLDDDGGYYVAVLLSGAYQEALAGKHNLFSGPSLVRVKSTGTDGGFTIDSGDLGPTTEEVIMTMRYNVQLDIKEAILNKARTPEEKKLVGELVDQVLKTMPYLNEYKPPRTT